MFTRARAFTLVELLVVVTIIVVLLSLLAPAMDTAIYQAELAVCGTSQRATAAGAIAYAMGSARRYPDRAGVRERAAWNPAWIYNGNEALNAAFNRPRAGLAGGGGNLNKLRLAGRLCPASGWDRVQRSGYGPIARPE